MKQYLGSLSAYCKGKEDLAKFITRKQKNIETMMDLAINDTSSMEDESENKILKIGFEKKRYSFIYNLENNQKMTLMTRDKQTIEYAEEDYLYVCYLPTYLLVFIITEGYYSLLKKEKNSADFEVVIWQRPWTFPQQRVREPILVASNAYLYRAFGLPLPGNQHASSIFRFSLLGKSADWEKVADMCYRYEGDTVSDKPKPLERKRLGYGFFAPELNSVVIMGGYLEQENQEKISKNLYLINKDEKKVLETGKTNKKLFTRYNSNWKEKKFPVYPFIYGQPFVYNKKTYILNTNGYFDNLNNNNKLFFTNFKVEKLGFGVGSQHRIKVDKEKSAEIFVRKDQLLYYMIVGNNKTNRLDGRTVLQNIDEDNGVWVVSTRQGVDSLNFDVEKVGEVERFTVSFDFKEDKPQLQPQGAQKPQGAQQQAQKAQQQAPQK